MVEPGSRVTIEGDVVRRPTYPWSPTVHDLLRHLEGVGFAPAPRFLGVDGDHELLQHLPGDSGADGWRHVVPESGLVAVAELLRGYHEAAATYRPAASAGWADHPGPVGAGEIVCHGDVGPWNMVWVDGRPVGLIDWDLAWPQPPIVDLAYLLEYVAPFRPDAECLRWLRYDTPPDRCRRMAIVAEAYGSAASIDDLITAVIDQQRRTLERATHLGAAGHEPQATWAGQGHLDDVRERIGWSEAWATGEGR